MRKRQKKEQEAENLRQVSERTQGRINALQAKHSTQLENEAEIRRLEILKKKIIKPNLKTKKKKWPSLKN